MIYDYHIVLGFISVVVGILGYIPYFRDIYRGKTKPHVFTWVIFALLNAIVFFGQVSAGAGAGAWVSAITVLGCSAIALTAFFRGEREITKTDWLCFIGALLGIVLWRITDEPLTAVVVVTVVDVFAFAPTFRKSYMKPHEETISTYVLSTLKYVLGIAALGSFNATTLLFPVAVCLLNSSLVTMLFIRRRQLKTTNA
ncbi:hypothetical protein A2851_03635 [Candidatus Kaiserbacteria bacterium RIFCSPHIGHO2_01_FULL_53_29]|uniref:Uncharacterized protein n=2 Tax=Candidatus Kaiseribacteriota TaxID=1752734 RepID=A0A1F6CVL1_9BACT|nr:MAG: hypothetical protein A2851_03635 [Candidatus Kaiserbacteria bacterium RIFCSPHIGHO2_01_FULL_53_29]